MKKILILILAVMLLIPAALAEDLSSLSDEELLNLQKQVEEELIRRNLYPLADDVPVDSENIALFERLDSFLSFWAASDYPNMLDYCVSDWKNQTEAPQTELLRILSNRTPLHFENVVLSGSPKDTERTASIILTIDKHNGHAPQVYFFDIIMKQEEDGLWYVDPRSLQSHEEDVIEPGLTPVPAEADADDILLYFNAENGQKYHLDPNCKTVHPNYLPLTDSFPFADVCDPKYADLQPCMICGAPVRPEAVSSAE